LDVDETGSLVEVLKENGDVILSVVPTIAGDNGVQTIFVGANEVKKINVILGGSGSLSEFCFIKCKIVNLGDLMNVNTNGATACDVLLFGAGPSGEWGATAYTLGNLKDVNVSNANNNDFLFFNGSNWGPTASPNSSIESIIFSDQKSQNTPGGTFTSGSWQTRTLNTTSGSISGASLSSNQFTLPAGTYVIESTAPAYRVQEHQSRIQNITDGITTALSTVSFTRNNGGSSMTNSLIREYFTC
jgi:hypothetical protein